MKNVDFVTKSFGASFCCFNFFFFLVSHSHLEEKLKTLCETEKKKILNT